FLPRVSFPIVVRVVYGTTCPSPGEKPADTVGALPSTIFHKEKKIYAPSVQTEFDRPGATAFAVVSPGRGTARNPTAAQPEFMEPCPGCPRMGTRRHGKRYVAFRRQHLSHPVPRGTDRGGQRRSG